MPDKPSKPDISELRALLRKFEERLKVEPPKDGDAALARAPEGESEESAKTEPAGKHDPAGLHALLRRIEEKTKAPAFTPREPVELEEAIPGRVVENARGAFYLIEDDAERFLGEDDAERFLGEDDAFKSVTDLVFRRGQANIEYLAETGSPLAEAAAMEPERMLYLDIETAGFHGSALFLIGLMVYRGGRFGVRQLLARDYAEEAAVLEHLRDYYEEHDLVITFNGRAFDLPMIADRAIIHRVKLPRPPKDLDLLHPARRMWRGTLPDCRLGTLEQFVCGRRRTGDVPSHLIPRLYHEFVENRDAYLLADVIRHNAYDLVTMAHLLARMVSG